MKNNLYDKIKYLVNRKYELKRLGGIIKFDKAKREEYERYALEYTQIENTLDYIRKNCVISPLKVAEIISEKEGTPYVLKIFMECVVRDGARYYTDDFVACYINSNNKYYDYIANGKCLANLYGLPSEKYVNYSLLANDFKELNNSLKKTNSYVLATRREQNFVPTLFPSNYLEVVNFVDLIIYGYVSDFVCDNFQKTIKSYIKQYLENIDADKFLAKNDKYEEK